MSWRRGDAETNCERDGEGREDRARNLTQNSLPTPFFITTE
jgi:hypothetical protein